LNPEFLVPAALLAAVYAHLDRLPEARAVLKTYCNVDNCKSALSESYWFPFKKDQDRKRFIDGLVRAGLS
ncbi:MAG: hypothetical protein V3R26_02920, partial [Hyphomicrobium sp.]